MSCCVSHYSFKSSKTSTFGVPMDKSLRLEWERALGITLRNNSRVCQNHFKNENIINTWVSG